MTIFCLLSIFMIKVPFIKFHGAAPIHLYNSRSVTGMMAAALLGGGFTAFVRIIYAVLFVLEIMALISIFRNNGRKAKLWNLLAGAYETLASIILLIGIYLIFKGYNDMIGIDLFEGAVGIGVYFSLVLGVLQVLVSRSRGLKKDGDIFDILGGE